MALKMTLWAFALLFIATIWNAVTAYSGMGDMNVQGRFQTIGLLEDEREVAAFPLPPHKPEFNYTVAAY
ncbi:MAG: hypothetical protein WC989_09030 [Micavibrio sp.]